MHTKFILAPRLLVEHFWWKPLLFLLYIFIAVFWLLYIRCQSIYYILHKHAGIRFNFKALLGRSLLFAAIAMAEGQGCLESRQHPPLYIVAETSRVFECFSELGATSYCTHQRSGTCELVYVSRCYHLFRVHISPLIRINIHWTDTRLHKQNDARESGGVLCDSENALLWHLSPLPLLLILHPAGCHLLLRSPSPSRLHLSPASRHVAEHCLLLSSGDT